MTANIVSIPGWRLLVVQRLGELFHRISKPLALVGLSVMMLCAIVLAQPSLRAKLENQTLVWLLNRFETRLGMPPEPEASDRVSAVNPQDLPTQQAATALWLSKKYRVAPEPISALVAEAYELGKSTQLDPSLILAVMAVESSFNPFAQSAVGAQGLMQVMTRVHTEKFQGYGGNLAAFDPVSNLRVGVKVLQECIARAGSITGGLKFYVGAALHTDDGGYSDKVLAEQRRLKEVAAGRWVSLNKPEVAAPASAQPAPVKQDGKSDQVALNSLEAL
jgi:hypothetical protein